MVSCRANRASSNGESGHALRCVRTVPSRLTTHPSLPAKQAVWHFSLQQVWAHACTRTAKKNFGFYVAMSPHGDQRVGLCTKLLFRADCPAAAGWTSAEDQTYDAPLEG